MSGTDFNKPSTREAYSDESIIAGHLDSANHDTRIKTKRRSPSSARACRSEPLRRGTRLSTEVAAQSVCNIDLVRTNSSHEGGAYVLYSG